MSHPESQAAAPPRLSAILVASDSAKPLNPQSGKLLIGRQRYELCAISGALEQSFEQPIEISSSCKIQVSISYGKIQLLSKRKTITIDAADILDTSQRGCSQVARDGVLITLTFQGQAMQTLRPTTELMLQECNRFRILVIGKTGVGKTTLIQLAFGIDKACASHLQRGQADINQELISPCNPHFVLHDSLGFEPGEKDNYTKAKEFIKSKQTGPMEGRLHAIWFCMKTPCSGERLLEAAMENFFELKQDTLGNIPLVVVFTKFDELVDEVLFKKSNDGNVADKGLEQSARTEAISIVLERYLPPITHLMKETPSYAIISTKQSYRDSLANLVILTYGLVSKHTGHDEGDAQVTSLLTSMAQRIVPHLKIQECIDVGKKNYWKAMSRSPDIAGHTIWDFLSVIHVDIVSVWNFHDPRCYLKNDKFMKLILELVRDVRVRNVPLPGRFIALSGASLVTTISAFIGALANPAAPIVLPIVAGVAGIVWLYVVYQHSKNVQKHFIAYIVDLTYVMETLFILVAGRHEPLTRRAIKLALRFYLDSDVRAQVHDEIESYQKIPGQNNAVKMIESLIKHEEGDGSLSEYYSKIRDMDLSKLRLNDEDEDW